MISKNELQYYSSLLTKKHRKAEKKFIVEGIKAVLDGINSHFECEVIFITNKLAEQHSEANKILAKVKTKIVSLRQKEFEKISDTKTPQGIAAVFVKPALKFSPELFSDENIIVMLDNISDPGNLGTIFRNCDWFGVKSVLLSSNIVDYTNPKVLRSSMGSVFHIKLFENIGADEMSSLKNQDFEILCADIKGENVFSYNSDKKKILILSSESHGPSKEIEKISEIKITIPKIGKAESLNVASASAVILAKLTR